MSQLLRVQNFNVSSDGFGAGEGQSLERPFGHADPGKMFAWAGATASWPNRTDPGGSRGLDDYLTRDFAHNIGAEIMGRNKFGPQRGPWQDYEWQGWWGDEPPFHTPVFVMTHHERPSFTLSDTTFHFVGGDPAEVLAQARKAAGGKDVRLGGAGRRPSGSSWTPTWSTRCTWRSRTTWCSGPDHGCGSPPRTCSTASTAMSCRARAG
ncbi:dihydrofolate reductase [Streptomyces luteogriseus]|nr:dihydrofolate reductase [Streptomyces luteogriseus]